MAKPDFWKTNHGHEPRTQALENDSETCVEVRPPLGDCVAIGFCSCEREIVGHVTPRGETNIAGSGHVPFRVDPAYIAFPPLDNCDIVS